MNPYRHHVSGFFAHREEAENALVHLAGIDLPRTRLHLLDADSTPPVPMPGSAGKKVLTNVLVDDAIGTAVGTGIGALAQVAIAAGSLSLSIASPLVAETRTEQETAGAREVIEAAFGEAKDVSMG